MIKINESENDASYVFLFGGTHFWSFTFGNLFFNTIFFDNFSIKNDDCTRYKQKNNNRVHIDRYII